MRVLIANDDGIEAPGLALLAAAAGRLSDDLWTVAPSAKRTAASHSLTMARPLRLEPCGPRRFACSGTPADCVVAAMTWLFRDGPRPDLVLSGVNDGPNVGEDLAYSGTLAVAREATFWGVPAIALSRVKRADVQPADADHLARLLSTLWAQRAAWVAEGSWLSVNLPHRLPARLRQPRIGRDKIAGGCEVLASDAQGAELVFPRGRSHASRPGDENDLLGQGFATLSRLTWPQDRPLPEGFAEGL